jgi:putative heme-binding domain-containing protein
MIRLFLLTLISLAPATLFAQSDLTTPPAEIGLSQEKLQRITALLQEQADSGQLAGAVAAISRHGKVGYMQAVGHRDLQSKQMMETDSLFRIASMTKAVTSAAIMSLVEDGEISLDDPVTKFVPAFSNPVLLKPEGSEPVAVPTIHDLLTHRSGLTYGWFGPQELDSVYLEHNIPNLFEPTTETMGDRAQRIAKMPLICRPGTAWNYSVSSDVLGHVVESVSGMTLEQFFRERFFRPLKMNDTFFKVPGDKQHRLSSLYTIDDEKNLLPVGDTPVKKAFFQFSANYCTEPNLFYSGGGGLVSTAGDYLRFLNMLLRGGELDGVRVLKRQTVALMTKNHIGDATIPFPGHGDGFGFGFGVVTDRGASSEDEFSVGSYSWGGIFNTYFWVDPQQQLVGVLMTQVFPNDHLTTRGDFRKLAYAAIDDSGFEKLYNYKPGTEFGNPHFADRQLRVNGPEVSTHPEFASRDEPRSSGMARIRVDEDLRTIRRVDLDLETWGGHPGTINKRVTVNGRSTHLFPEVGTADHHCTHQHPTFNLQPNDLVNGYNSLQFACDTGDTFWGHYIVDRATIRVGLQNDDQRLVDANLGSFKASVKAKFLGGGGANEIEGYAVELDVDEKYRELIGHVEFEAYCLGYDRNGDGWNTDWRRTDGSFFHTRMLPAQKKIPVRAIVEFKGLADLRYRVVAMTDLEIKPKANEKVTFYSSNDLPNPFWSRDNQVKSCTIDLDTDPANILEAELHVIAWTGGAGDVADYFTLNGQPLKIAEGHEHITVSSKLSIDPKLLRKGENRFELRSDTKHHGIEILLPGPTLAIRHKVDANDNGKGGEESSSPKAEEISLDATTLHSLECYRIKTPIATYYLDKVGAGLASMIDRDGKDWLSFNPKKGSGAKGEYRGFPNAVFQEAGSYFHARNAGTDPCSTRVDESTSERVVISATSDNGKWAGRYSFTSTGCTFTMTKKPEGHNFWVLYEGTPGGQFDDSDWWMTGTDKTKRPMTEKQDGDLSAANDGGEWIAFGDKQSPRMLVMSHHEDDPYPDRFYQMENSMTVFGFGRAGMKKHLSTAPQSFTIGFVESTEYADALAHVENVCHSHEDRNADQPAFDLASFALTAKGDAVAGRKIYLGQKAKCATCHKVEGEGGQVGPDLSSIGGKFDRPHLIDSLLNPSSQITYGYETTILLTEDGNTLTGVVKEKSDTEITLLDAEDKQVRIPRSEIEQMKSSNISVMPTGLADSLDRQEFVDLVTYLESLGRPENKFGAGIAGPVQLAESFELTTVATGLSGAVAMEIAPDGRIFVCEQSGHLRVIKDDGSESSAKALLDQPFVSIPVEMNWERGLIGVTVSPDFPHDPYVYVVYVTDKPYTHHRVSRFRVSKSNSDVAIAGSEEVLFRGDDQSKFGGHVPAGHQGGAIHFGADGKLYIGIGEQTAGTPSQRMDAIQGKILRLNADGSIPDDNPFLDVTEGKYRAIWAKGCRNPFTFAFDSKGNMLINDVGGKFEEINRGIAGANYGWPGVDHGPTDQEGITGPIHVYPESSINGGDFCDATSPWPEKYRNKYFFADFNQGWVKFIDPDSAEKSHDFLSGIRRPVDLRFASDGSLYVLLRNAWVVDKKFEGGTGALVKISRKK